MSPTGAVLTAAEAAGSNEGRPEVFAEKRLT